MLSHFAADLGSLLTCLQLCKPLDKVNSILLSRIELIKVT
jgi:SWI/SNF-related matrix-associated actin-dependent regulator of chromatin subfamily A3